MKLCGLFSSKKNSENTLSSNHVSVKKTKANVVEQMENPSSILDREPIRTQLMTLVMIQFGNIHEIPEDFVEYVTSKIFEKIKKIGEEESSGQVTINSVPQLHCQIMYKQGNRQGMNSIIKSALKIKTEIEAISFLSERQGEGVPRIVFKISISTGENMYGNIGIPNVSSIFGPVSVRGIKLLDLATILDMSLMCDFNSMLVLYQESNVFLEQFLYTIVHRLEFSKGDVQCAFQILSESTVSQLDQWRYGSNEERNQYINFLSEINHYFHGMLSELAKENAINQTEYSNLSIILTKGKSPISTPSLEELKNYELGGEPLSWKLKLWEIFSNGAINSILRIQPSIQ